MKRCQRVIRTIPGVARIGQTELKNLAASVKARLANLARTQKENFQELLAHNPRVSGMSLRIVLGAIFFLVSCLKHNRSSVDIFAPSPTVQLYTFDRELNVQIDGLFSGLWHASNVDLATAREALKATTDGCEDFGAQIPGTNVDWDVY